MIACDLLSIDTIGLQRLYALVFLAHDTRTLHVAGVTCYRTPNNCLGRPLAILGPGRIDRFSTAFWPTRVDTRIMAVLCATTFE
ncbi:hypothetical protein ACR6C2_01180 [Streptomyces sp. INA 01156]